MRQTIGVKGARENNLRNIEVELPRDKFIVVTGLSGSGKSSLAFETIYAEGQRRFLESLPTFSKRFTSQLKKPDVDFVTGLSPVISIEQKTVSKNPRSTIATMTDIADYLRLLFATIGVAHCPRCEQEIPVRSALQMLDHLFSLPQGTLIEIGAPVFKIYGEDYNYLFGELRSKGCRKIRINGELRDMTEDLEMDEGRDVEMDVVIDRIVVRHGMDKHVLTSLENGLRVGNGFLSFRVLEDGEKNLTQRRGDAEEGTKEKGKAESDPIPYTLHPTPFSVDFCCPEHQTVMGETTPNYFSFNDPEGVSFCQTCMGLGIYLKVHPDLLVPDKTRSIKGGAFIPEAFKYDKNLWNGRLMYSLSQHYGFDLDAPFAKLPPHIVDIVFYGSKGERFPQLLPPGATKGDQHIGRLFRWDGIINDIERNYRRYRKQQVAHTHMEMYLRRVMVEHVCPDCQGTKLRRQRLLVTVNGKSIHEVGELPNDRLSLFLAEVKGRGRQKQAGDHVLQEIRARIGLLNDIGLDYLNLNRRATTLSGGESQRIRLSTQISSGLMGMLYVLDEPSVGLHPKDNVKLIGTLKKLRDIGNTVIVVEHDEETIRAADHVLEIGPGPGIHGGQVVAQGTPEEIIAHPDSLTGLYLSGRKRIEIPAKRRQGNGQTLTVRGAKHNNLRNIDVEIPLGMLICITGASGSGKSTLVNEILYKRLFSLFHDSRVMAGQHEAMEGVENLHDVISIDQSPIGRSTRSNPATYIGFYDSIRRLFADLPESQARGYTPSRFSFNVKGGRCEECQGEGILITKLHFMPDVENLCQACKGARYNADTLEIQWRGKNIADVLALPVEEAVCFFKGHALIAHKIGMLQELGLGYLTLGQASTTLSGGEAQRVKLANELSKIKRGGKNLYILDEPTTGLHLADIQRLLDSLNRLVEAGNTVLVIEHHLDVIKTADWVIDLGPEGGYNGGQVLAVGPPETIAACPDSHTGRFLRKVL